MEKHFVNGKSHLSKSHFEEVERFADKNQDDQVRDKKGATTVVVSNIREAPYVSCEKKAFIILLSIQTTQTAHRITLESE